MSIKILMKTKALKVVEKVQLIRLAPWQMSVNGERLCRLPLPGADREYHGMKVEKRIVGNE